MEANNENENDWVSKVFHQTHGNPPGPRDVRHGKGVHYDLLHPLPPLETSSSLSPHDNPRDPRDVRHGKGVRYDRPPLQ